MRIQSIERKPLAVPLRRLFRWRSGVQHGANLVFVSLTTGGGVTGHGECVCEGPAAFEAYGRALAGLGRGDPRRGLERGPLALHAALHESDRERPRGRVLRRSRQGARRAGLDLPRRTRARGGRLHGLFPGRCALRARRGGGRAVGEGSRVVYLKAGRDEDVATVAAVREAIGPGPLLRVDPNEVWDVPTAVERPRELERHGLDWVEQPVAAANVSGLARVRRSVRTNIAVDQAVYTTGELRAVLEREAAGVIVLGHHETGGLWRLRQAAYLAEAHGLPINRHTCMESAISTVSALLALAAIPNLTLGNQVMHQLLGESLLVEPQLDLAGGRVPIPSCPGPGFELDHDAVDRAHERYRTRGHYPSVERAGA